MGKVLSIAVPSYNVEKYLEKGLTSFADARLEDTLEVLIVNDGSQDQTESIAQSYVERFPNIFRLINKENGGHGSAVNSGIQNASGKYFRVVDGDDWVNTDNLVKLIDKMKDLDCDLVIDEKCEENMETKKREQFPIPDYVEKNVVCDFDKICNREDIGSYIMIHTMSVKTAILQECHVTLQEHIFYVDYEYIVKATCESNSIIFLDLEVYQYLVGNVNQSVFSQNYVRRYSHHDQVTKEILRYADTFVCTGARREYLDRKTNLIIHTHYNIALIFNLDRKQGLKQAREFRTYLKQYYPYYEAETRKRYYQALILHYLGVNAEKLDRMMGRK